MTGFDSFHRLRSTEVRDLVFALGAPGLLAPSRPEILSDAECLEFLLNAEARIWDLDQDPQPLQAFLAQACTSQRLGRYFEALIEYAIRELLAARRVQPSWVINRGRDTMGELDFIFEDASSKLQHWEATAKFYLCVGPARDDWRSFLGTQLHDRLDLKASRLLGALLGLAHGAEATRAFNESGWSGPLISRALVKGMLFYPRETDWQNGSHPPQVASAHRRGWWSTEFPREGTWIGLEKRRWLSPLSAPVDSLKIFEKGDLPADARRLPPAAWMLARVEEESGYWVERERGIVVLPDWLEKARAWSTQVFSST